MGHLVWIIPATVVGVAIIFARFAGDQEGGGLVERDEREDAGFYD